MAERDLTSTSARMVLGSAVFVLLACGVGNVLLAVVESVLWPLVVGMTWVVVAALVVIDAESATPPRSGTHPAEPLRVSAATPARS